MLKAAEFLLLANVAICGVFAEDTNALLRHKANTRLRRDVELEQNFRSQAQNIQVFEKISSRVMRATSSTCKDIEKQQQIDATYGEDLNITCSCSGELTWFDQTCEQGMFETDRISMSGSSLIIKNYNASDSTTYFCIQAVQLSGNECSDGIDITGQEAVTRNGGVIGLVVCVILAAVIVMLICFVRKYKAGISLCLRDTCQPNNGSDGKVYDAYVSTGVSETDRRFVEGFVHDVLIKKYGYNLYIDDKNILPRLDYSDKLQANLHKCRRLVVVFSASYMTHDWCMYCFNEGLRKLLDLHVQMVFVITDHSILSELRAHADLIAHVPQILLTEYQTVRERQHAIERVRQKMPPPMRSVSFRKRDGMRSPMLSDAESIHKSDINFNSNGSTNYDENGREYTFGPPEKLGDDIQMEYDEPEVLPEGPDDFVTAVQTGEEIDPNKVKVHEYNARKDFYSLTMQEETA